MVFVLALDGRFDLQGEMYPAPLRLFEELEARGYRPSAEQPWNFFSGLYGARPTIERRLAEVRKQRDQAAKLLEQLLQDERPSSV